MTDTSFTLGDTVLTPTASGMIIDLRATPSGKWVHGVEDSDGVVIYTTDRALRRADV